MQEHKIPYDCTNSKSIETYAKNLLNKSLRDVLGAHIENKYKGKGKLGQALEDLYFHYKPNPISGPDFLEAGVELKSAPLKKVKKGYSPKERLVFNMINYMEEYKSSFEESGFWKKNKKLLLMMFLHEKEKEDLDYIFKIIRLWEFPEKDLKIIKDDWHKIISIIRQGRAHELSEGDTLYLGACTKGVNRKQLRKQPFSEVRAKPRAFSLKPKYLKFIIEESLPDNAEAATAVTDDDFYKKDQTFEEYIIQKFEKFYGLSDVEIFKQLNVPYTKAKHKNYILSKAILGVRGKKIEEFEKADLLLKTVQFEHNGVLRESMSFAQIKYKEIVQEEWEDSYLHEVLTKRFFFVVFQKDERGISVLKKALFWTMPVHDLEVAYRFWEDTKGKIKEEKFDDFIKISDRRICHVRPKAVKKKTGEDLMETASGRMEQKKCYWLNSFYIKSILQEESEEQEILPFG